MKPSNAPITQEQARAKAQLEAQHELWRENFDLAMDALAPIMLSPEAVRLRFVDPKPGEKPELARHRRVVACAADLADAADAMAEAAAEKITGKERALRHASS